MTLVMMIDSAINIVVVIIIIIIIIIVIIKTVARQPSS